MVYEADGILLPPPRGPNTVVPDLLTQTIVIIVRHGPDTAGPGGVSRYGEAPWNDRHQADADLGALVKSGCGDMLLTEPRFRYSESHTDRTDFVVTSRDGVKPR